MTLLCPICNTIGCYCVVETMQKPFLISRKLNQNKMKTFENKHFPGCDTCIYVAYYNANTSYCNNKKSPLHMYSFIISNKRTCIHHKTKEEYCECPAPITRGYEHLYCADCNKPLKKEEK